MRRRDDGGESGKAPRVEQLEHLVGLAKKYNAGFQPIPMRPIGKGDDIAKEVPTKEQLAEYTKLATQ